MDSFNLKLQEIEKTIILIDRLVYVNLPLINDKTLFLNILIKLKKTLINTFSLILHYEYFFRRISLSKNPETNFNTFKEKCALRYGLSQEDLKLIEMLFRIVEYHKNSSMEVFKQDKIFIFSESLV